MVWKPNVTVAAVVERDGRFLCVEEETDNGLMINQPAGHLEDDESLIAAVTRETLEETAWHFLPTALIGVYRWRHPDKPITYLRFAFTGELLEFDNDLTLDDGIVRALWLSRDELEQTQHRHRSPQVLRCVDDYQNGIRLPLEVLHDL
ncbi:MAG: 7,8-dihydro-8-oxoguanine-triphosphatase [Acidithiobacillales bacterium SG8_45]|nr:MAG: 7,8-dihydro-8-oxoguanine-triphosphatase [Acidithiobacillales bacterium SG8_45]